MKICRVCGLEFERRGTFNLYCQACSILRNRETTRASRIKKAAERPSKYRTCRVCGITYQVRSRSLCCGVECRRGWEQQRMKKWHEAHFTPQVRECRYCSKVFHPHGAKPYCSSDCKRAAHNDRWRARPLSEKLHLQRKTRLRNEYGLSLDEYSEMLLRQGGVCAICGKQQGDKGIDRLAVDHDHKTGNVRGLLCSACNQGLGHFRDESSLLIAAIQYLRCGEKSLSGAHWLPASVNPEDDGRRLKELAG